MSAIHRTTPSPAPEPALPPLVAGERLDQKTFHARYEAMPPDVRAELVGGVVYVMTSPLKSHHGELHSELMTWLTLYKAATPGTRVLDNATMILGDYGEVQPDGMLLLRPECGGRTHENADGYVEGTPELVAEVSVASESYDLNVKRQDYERAGVREYLVVVVRQNRVAWWVRRGQSFEPLEPGADGTYRSECFPGLWLDGAALLRCDSAQVHAVLRQGLASEEHARFVEQLRRSRQS